ncbi:MAG: choline-sulfatase [Ilumatobacter sp.]|uniref:choline-sulfatase n=1 Tax=Ilumatobacter sp. TaxID=1967498 RepID=UPI0026289800|nr:choline-sulfatase [Ilumatobacter sp.]MDJ0769386.1 choline-sulfatase [Ilumatobacter sp.]
MTGRPNLLLVMADQLAAPFLRCYGGDTAITPAIDRLAEEGVVFESAYANSPLCAPSRFSMMSGRLNSVIGAYDNASEFPASVPTFAHHLRSAGYQTSLIGKMHFVGPDQLHGFEERLTTDIYPADFGWTPNWDDPDGRFDWWFHNMDSVTDAGVAEASNQLDFDDDVGHQALRKLRDLARTSDDRPWFVTVSFTHPHDPYVARPEFWERYDRVEIPMPAVADGAVTHDRHSERLRHVIAADVTSVTDDQIRAARRAYFANVSYVDDWLRQIRDTLERFDLADDTVTVFTADHGDMLGERGLWYKMSFFEHSARVPLIVHDPARRSAAQATTHVSLLDLAPTLLDLAGVEATEPMEGASVLPFVSSPDPDRTVVGEYLGEGAVAPIFMIRRGDLKLVWCSADPPQLYDVAADPHELTNLADDPAHGATLESFTAEVTKRWDVDRIDAEVRASQRDRADVDRALRRGRYRSWDHQPTVDAGQQYMRNHLDLNDVESGRRY